MSPNLKNLTIVVVEDNVDVRRHVGAFLDRSGAKVVTARNGHEGLEKFRAPERKLQVFQLENVAAELENWAKRLRRYAFKFAV